MPQGNFTPVAMFFKQRGELQPTLLQDDHVEVSLTPNQEIDAGQVVLTFRMSDESVVPKVIRQENSNFQVDSSNISEPINSVQIAAVDTELDIPEHDLSTASFLNRLERVAKTQIQLPQLRSACPY